MVTLLWSLLVFRFTLLQSAAFAYICVFGVGWVNWQMPIVDLIGAAQKGGFIAADIRVIVFGAMFFRRFLSTSPHGNAIEHALGPLSPNRRVQAVIMASMTPHWRRWVEIVPWSIWTGAAFLVSFVMIANFGPEFPSLLSLS